MKSAPLKLHCVSAVSVVATTCAIDVLAKLHALALTPDRLAFGSWALSKLHEVSVRP